MGSRFMIGSRRVVNLMIVAMAALMLGGCLLGRPVRKKPAEPEFNSPLPPTGQAGMTLNEVKSRLEDREARVRTIKSNGSLIIGGGRGMPRQQFDVAVSTELPTFVRVRGSQDTGTVFDLVVDRGDVKMIIYPERKFFRGDLSDLRRNPSTLMGINPNDIIMNFVVEQTLLERLDRSQATFEETPDHYLVTVHAPGGDVERYSLRKADLLADMVERFSNNQLVSTVRFFAYQLSPSGAVLPTRFDVQLATGNEFSMTINNVQTGEPISQQLRMLEVPLGFDRMSIGR